MVAYWEIAAYYMFSKYKYLIVNLDFSTSVFRGGISFWLRLFPIIDYLYLFVRLLIYFYIAHMILLHINNSLPRDRIAMKMIFILELHPPNNARYLCLGYIYSNHRTIFLPVISPMIFRHRR